MKQTKHFESAMCTPGVCAFSPPHIVRVSECEYEYVFYVYNNPMHSIIFAQVEVLASTVHSS